MDDLTKMKLLILDMERLEKMNGILDCDSPLILVFDSTRRASSCSCIYNEDVNRRLSVILQKGIQKEYLQLKKELAAINAKHGKCQQ